MCTKTFATLAACIATMVMTPTASAAPTVGSTQVPLDTRVATVRYEETNAGNLVADALHWQTAQSGLDPTIGLQNGGGVRGNAILFPTATASTPADISVADLFTLQPFGNSVGVIAGVSIADLLLALENAVSRSAPGDAGGGQGRFLQVSGLAFVWNPSALAGTRINDVGLADGTPLVTDGLVVSSMLVNIATIDFLANGGDGYDMLSGYTFLDSGILDHDALMNYIDAGLGGLITATDYPVGGEGRIERIPEPGSLALLGLGLAGLGWSRRMQ